MLPILLFTLLVVLPFTKPDLGSDRSALLALRLAVGGRTLLWNVTESSPCFWAGVKCEDNRVAALRLPGVALSGQLPTGIFGNLTRLRTLSMRLNALTGQVPSDLTSCVNLRNLYLQGNLFSGEIPDFLFTLRDLVRLNLANNNFSGGIPLSFNNLTRLKTLFLENNQLTGSIPPAIDIPKLEQFNVSNNLLNGSVPQKLQTFKQDSFLGNSLCGQPFVACSSSFQNVTLPAENNGGKKKKLSGGAIAGIAIGSVLAFLLILVILIVVCRKKSSSKKTSAVDIATAKHSEVEIPGEKPVGEVENGRYGNGYSVAAAAVAAMTGNAKAADANGNGGGVKKLVFFGNAARVFDLEDLLRASAEVLGKGTFGTAYKAVLEMGTVVAVKRLKDVTISDKEFKEKIEAVGAMDHENLVPLRAYYYSRDEKLLVHDYMAMGSLSALLHGEPFCQSVCLLSFGFGDYLL